VAATVVLNGGNAFRVLNVNPGASGVVQIIGLNITGGQTVSDPSGPRASATVKSPIAYPMGDDPIAPMGKWLTCLPRLSLPQLAPVNYRFMYINLPQRLKISHRPDGKTAPDGRLTFARCLQGGGVYVHSGTVSIVNSQIYSNTADYVHAHAQNFPSPQWERS
jgi:hypothetical protein